jgi:hypothetical protein
MNTPRQNSTSAAATPARRTSSASKLSTIMALAINTSPRRWSLSRAVLAIDGDSGQP